MTPAKERPMRTIHNIHRALVLGVCLVTTTAIAAGPDEPSAPSPAKRSTMRVGTTQPKSRLIDWHIKSPAEVLSRVDASLTELEGLVHKAGAARCDVVALP